MLRQIPGVKVEITSSLGNGFPDLVVGYRGVTHLWELKDGNKPKSAQKLTPDEQNWIARWTGKKVNIITNIDDAIQALS